MIKIVFYRRRIFEAIRCPRTISAMRPQCFRIPATEKPGFFAVRSGTERLTMLPSMPGPMRFAAGSPPLELKTARSPASSSTAPYPPFTFFLAELNAGWAFVPIDPSSPSDQMITRRTRFGQEVEAAGRARHQVYRKISISKNGRCGTT
jgi:hypothetical protein